MNEIVYRPGAWQVVVDEAGVIAVPADAAHERVVELAGMLQRGAPELTEVIGTLSGGSIAALGSFAVVLPGADGTRFAVRGDDVAVRIDGAESFSGAGIRTWSERFVPDAVDFELTLGAAADGVEYPIRAGVVRAGAVRTGNTVELADAPGTDEPVAAGVVIVPGGPSDVAVIAEPDVADRRPAPDPEAPDAAPSTDETVADPAEPAAVEEGVVQHTLIPTDVTYAPPADDPAEASAPLLPPPPVPAGAGAPTAPFDAVGDHDGATISLAEARRLRVGAAPDAPTEVLPATDAPIAPANGRIRVSSGQVVDLDRTIIIGRRPRSTRASGATMPHLVAVESPQQDISRSHLEIRPDGDSVVVIDLHTTNGSTLLRPGADPVRLHPGEHTLVLDGDTVDLGDGVTVRFEGLT